MDIPLSVFTLDFDRQLIVDCDGQKHAMQTVHEFGEGGNYTVRRYLCEMIDTGLLHNEYHIILGGKDDVVDMRQFLAFGDLI